MSAARAIVYKDGTGNLVLEGDFTADHPNDSITLMYHGTGWFELSRSNNN